MNLERGRNVGCEVREVHHRRRSYSGEEIDSVSQSVAISTHSSCNSNSNSSNSSTVNSATVSRRMMMTRSRSLSHSRLAASSCACFAPLPDYAKYQERKIQRALSRSSIFVEPPSPRFESRQTRTTICMEDLTLSSSAAFGGRQPVSPTQTQCERLAMLAAHPPQLPFEEPANSSPGRPSQYNTSYRSHSSRCLGREESSNSSLRCLSRANSCNSLQVPMSPSLSPHNPDVIITSPHGNSMGTPIRRRRPPVFQRRHSMPSPHTSPLPPPPVLVPVPVVPPKEPAQVEIFPGVSVVLRNVEETMSAIRNDFFIPATCFGCALDLFCISDAQYIICPTCRVVSPLELPSPSSSGEEKQSEQQWGLGLGVTYESLITIQAEIVNSGNRNR